MGRGIGRVLLAEARAALSALGCRPAVLWVAEANARARRFYDAA
jgi:ribosomal protein S18 acetylase RimI-like enzyme